MKLILFVLLIGTPFSTLASYVEAPLSKAILKPIRVHTQYGETNLFKLADTSKPVLLVPAYFSCNSTCPLMTENLKKAFNSLNNNFRLNVIILSINKSDGINDLKSFKDHHELPKQWSFAVIKDEAEAKDFLKTINYQFEKTKYGFEHPNAAFLFSAKKKWSGVFVGLDNKSEDLEKALLTAEQFDNDSKCSLFSRYIKQPEFFIYVGLSGLLICFGIIFSILFGKKLKAKNAN